MAKTRSKCLKEQIEKNKEAQKAKKEKKKAKDEGSGERESIF